MAIPAPTPVPASPWRWMGWIAWNWRTSPYWEAVMITSSRLDPRLDNMRDMGRGGGGTDIGKEPQNHPAGADDTTLAGTRTRIGTNKIPN